MNLIETQYRIRNTDNAIRVHGKLALFLRNTFYCGSVIIFILLLKNSCTHLQADNRVLVMPRCPIDMLKKVLGTCTLKWWRNPPWPLLSNWLLWLFTRWLTEHHCQSHLVNILIVLWLMLSMLCVGLRPLCSFLCFRWARALDYGRALLKKTCFFSAQRSHSIVADFQKTFNFGR